MSLAILKKKSTAGKFGKNFKSKNTTNYGTRYVKNNKKPCNANKCCPNSTQPCNVFKKFPEAKNNILSTQSTSGYLYNKINTQLKNRFTCLPNCDTSQKKTKKPLIRSYESYLRYKKAGVGARETDWSNLNPCCN
tara:strand:+ start:301 stop:705 length:405 start_codon:yes stop_codon:yes gene_type:complete